MKKKLKPTKTQQLLIDLIMKYKGTYKKYPTFKQLATALNCSDSGVRERVLILRQNGFVPKHCCLKQVNKTKLKK